MTTPSNPVTIPEVNRLTRKALALDRRLATGTWMKVPPTSLVLRAQELEKVINRRGPLDVHAAALTEIIEVYGEWLRIVEGQEVAA